MPQLIGEEEDVSVYDIADHPDFRFRTTDIVIRIGNAEDGAPHKEDEVRTLVQAHSGCPSLAAAAVPGGATRWLQKPTCKPCRFLAAPGALPSRAAAHSGAAAEPDHLPRPRLPARLLGRTTFTQLFWLSGKRARPQGHEQECSCS